MKKRWKILPIFVLIVFGMLALCACQPGAVEDVEGTYELQTFSRRYPDEMPAVAEGETAPEQTYTTHDYMQEAQVKAYLVVKKDGTGYAVYQDKDTALIVESIRFTFTKDSDDNSLISSLNYTNGYASGRTTGVKKEKEPIPGRGEEQLYVNARSSGVTLVRDYPIYHGLLIDRPYSQDVTYRKVDKATDLSYVGKALGKTLTAPAFELQGLDGVLTISGSYSETDYIYCALQINAFTQKASLYYALKSDGLDVVKNDLAVTYRPETTESSSKMLFTIDGKTYYSYSTGNNVATTFNYEGTKTVDGVETPYTEYYYKTTQTAAEYIAAQKEDYDEWLGMQDEE